MPSQQTIVSIVLPTYNRAAYLSQAINSCQRQTYQEWELIIVDDASTDETSAVIAAAMRQDARIRTVRHPANRRLPAALNSGFGLSQGTFLTWTSDDDLFLPQALELLVAAFTAQPHADFIYTDYDVIDSGGKFLKTNIAPLPNELIFGEERVACFLYRRAIYEKIGDYAEDLFLAEDYDYILRILNTNFHMVSLHENLYQYRRHTTSLTDVYRGRTFHAAERALKKNLPMMTWADRTQRTKAFLHLASLAKWQGCQGRAFRYTVQASLVQPTVVAHKLVSYGNKRARGYG